MKVFSLFTLFFTAVLLSSCNTVNVTYDFDRNTDFNSYKTYNFHQKGIDKLDLNDLDKRRILTAIEANMKLKGFTKSDNPDLYVNVLASSKEKINVDNGYYGPYWGGPYWGGPSRVYQYTSGTIIIDVVDDKRNILVWQGAGSGLNVSNLNTKADDIPKAIEEILKNFPPKAKK